MITDKQKIAYKKWYDKNKKELIEKRKSYLKEYYKNHKEELKQKVDIEKRKEKDNKRYQQKREEILLKKKIFYQENQEALKERSIQWRKDNPEKTKLSRTRYRKTHPEKIKEKRKRYQIKHSKELSAKAIRYRNSRYIPKWITKEELEAIKRFYINCPKGYQVDHIVPLNGNSVTGFHVLSNLQYITKEENLIKSNKFPYYPLKFYMDKGLMGVKNYGNL